MKYTTKLVVPADKKRGVRLYLPFSLSGTDYEACSITVSVDGSVHVENATRRSTGRRLKKNYLESGIAWINPSANTLGIGGIAPGEYTIEIKKGIGRSIIVDLGGLVALKTPEQKKPEQKKPKNIYGIVRDHSQSMRSIATGAMNDFNSLLEEIENSSIETGVETVGIVVAECGYGFTQDARIIESSKNSMFEKITQFQTNGYGTPLWDSIGMITTKLKSMDVDDNTSFVVIAITDGQENSSRVWTSTRLQKEIADLQATDRWTFAFRVPCGHSNHLTKRLGVSSGNVMEWSQTAAGIEHATKVATAGIKNFNVSRAAGQRSTTSFFANIGNVSESKIRSSLTDITSKVMLWPIAKSENGEAISSFVTARSKSSMIKGAAFYQLTKSEKVQDYKKIVVRDKKNNAIYSGREARDLLKIPHVGTINLRPGDFGDYDLFVQSTSYNRKLQSGTQLLYWPEAA